MHYYVGGLIISKSFNRNTCTITELLYNTIYSIYYYIITI